MQKKGLLRLELWGQMLECLLIPSLVPFLEFLLRCYTLYLSQAVKSLPLCPRKGVYQGEQSLYRSRYAFNKDLLCISIKTFLRSAAN
jgi:hypothetical protein